MRAVITGAAIAALLSIVSRPAHAVRAVACVRR